MRRALVTATFILLQSLRKPISLLGLLLTIEMMMHYFSLPWIPSTVLTSGGGNPCSVSMTFKSATCLL